MESQKPLLAAETEALKAAYAALNRNDIPAMVQAFDPQIERIEFAESPQGGAFRGLEAVTAHIAKARATWAEGTCEPQRMIVAGDRVVVLTQVRVRLKGETDWREGRTGDVFVFRNGKAVLFRTFVDPQQAMQWAGIEAPDAI